MCDPLHRYSRFGDRTGFPREVFREAHRILKKDGIFRFTTPAVNLYYKAYKLNDRNFYWWVDLYSSKEVCERIGTYPFNRFTVSQYFLFSFATHTSTIVKDKSIQKISDDELKTLFDQYGFTEALNFITSKITIEAQRKFPGYHMNWWNWEKAERVLREAGFHEIYKSGFGQSVAPVMRNTVLFDNQDPKDSLYVEAIR